MFALELLPCCSLIYFMRTVMPFVFNTKILFNQHCLIRLYSTRLHKLNNFCRVCFNVSSSVPRLSLLRFHDILCPLLGIMLPRSNQMFLISGPEFKIFLLPLLPRFIARLLVSGRPADQHLVHHLRLLLLSAMRLIATAPQRLLLI